MRGVKPNITRPKEDVRPTNYYTNDELYQRPMTAAENRIIRTLSQGDYEEIKALDSKFFCRSSRHGQHLRNNVEGNGLQGTVEQVFEEKT